MREASVREEVEIVEEVVQATTPLTQSQTAAPLIESAAPVVAEPQRASTLKLDWPSDLVQIETDPEKVRAVVVEEEVAPRPRRVRAVAAPVADEPLVQVETRKREPVMESAPL